MADLRVAGAAAERDCCGAGGRKRGGPRQAAGVCCRRASLWAFPPSLLRSCLPPSATCEPRRPLFAPPAEAKRLEAMPSDHIRRDPPADRRTDGHGQVGTRAGRQRPPAVRSRRAAPGALPSSLLAPPLRAPLPPVQRAPERVRASARIAERCACQLTSGP